MLAVILSHTVSEFAVAARAAKLFDPWMLIGRRRLRGKLPTDPVRFFGQDHVTTERAGAQRRCDSACSTADDEDVCFHHGFGDHWSPLYEGRILT